MAKSIARGKALVAKLRATPGVRDAEALAAWIGRRKGGGAKKSGAGKVSALKSKKSVLDDLDEDYGENEPKSKDEQRQEKYEARLIREQEKAERSRLYSAIQDAGGLQTRKDLREEYAGIPNTYKRKDGLAGDVMAEYLNAYFPEFGIEDENDLISFLAA